MALDYTKFNSTGSPSTAQMAIDKRWWKLNQTDMPAAITGIVSFLQQNQGQRMTQNMVSARLYGNLSLMGMNGLSYSKVASVQNASREKISYNVVQSCIDTVCAKISKNKPKPLFLTSGGDYRTQRRAKKLDKFIDGVFYENKAYDLGVEIFRDGCVFGSGIVHVFEHEGRVKYERVLSSELYVDEVEGFYGYPRQIHRVKNVDRQVLMDCYPSHRSAIANASQAIPDTLGGYQNISDVITIRESWHLPSGKDASDGCHVITIDGATLLVEDYKKDRFPLAVFHWCKRLYGFWGQGLAEQVQNIQLEINKLLWVIQRSMHLAGSFKVLLENGSKIVKEHLNNDVGAILSYTGTPPQYVTPPIVPQEIYQHLETLDRKAFEQAGISQLSAASQKPAGLDSGKALREFNDIETDRFMTVGQAYQQFFLDLSTLTIDCAKEIYEAEGFYSVKVPDKKFIESIDWKDIDLEEDEYVMKQYPISSLPNDPAGRLQTIQEYAQAGFITPRTARRLLDFPDLEQIEDLANSTEDFIHECLEKIVEADVEDDESMAGAYTPPEPYDDLTLARELALEYYAQGKVNNLEEEKLDLIRKYIDAVNLLQAKSLPQQAMPGPQAVPNAPPQSDLLPNVPQQAA